ncbi:CPBP family intramembrane glutamic endopeptidase [Oligoflexus tunisiensis]|uniref:CPBP family intramembrane glutamic endopeptidase n=1 Tax=Oligoflexus tunisiensis TaxID=708132 RepID=UPI00159F347A|nr:CPBP family intramembrane glutamic endopeptidase [Oligoflexus tunisiensis]
MKRNQLIMLTIIAATFIVSSYWQSVVGLETTRSNVLLSYAIWFALDIVAIWSIFAIGRIRLHEPKRSPLELGWLVLFLIGALAFCALSATAIGKLASTFNPEIITQLEAVTQRQELRLASPSFSFYWPLTVAPIAEELIYRVGILGGLMQFMKKSWAIILSSIIFAVMHAGIYPSALVASTFIFGLAAAATYLMLGLRAAIILHLISNSHVVWRPWVKSHEYLTDAYVLIMITTLFVFIHQLIRHRKMVFG